MLVLSMLIALAPPPVVSIWSQPQASPEPPVAPSRRLSDIQGVTVSYYDVTGTTVPQLHDWLAKHGPRNPQTGQVIPGTSSWSIGSAVRFTRTGGQCGLTAATLKFTATAQLPRLAPDQKISPAVVASWNAYVAALEDRQAAQLGFVHDRLGEVEGAIMHSSCDSWQKAASVAIDRLNQEQAEAFKSDPKTQPKLLEPGKEL